MENILTELDRRNLKLQHKKERDKRVCDRIKAVLLRDKGWSNKQIAEVLLLDDETVRLHIDEYKSSCKLKPENGGSEEKSATECASILDVCHRLRVIKETEYTKGRELLIRVVSMLIKMAQTPK